MDTQNGQTTMIHFPERLDATNTAQYLEIFSRKLDAMPADTAAVADLTDTNYLSSSGLRLILTLAKKRPELSLIHVRPEVYEVLDMTGLVKKMRIERQIMKIDPITTDPIARGSNGEVYAIEKDTIVKMFSNKTTADEIREEWQNAKIALTLGVPSAICYSVVTDGERLGIMFERMETTSLASLVYADYDNFAMYAEEFAQLLKEMHEIRDELHELHSVKEAFLSLIEKADYLPAEEREKMTAFLHAVPDRDNVVHGDFHPNNIGEVFGELILLDMAEIGYGNPLFDFIASYYDLVLSGATVGKEHPEVTKKFFGLEVAELAKLWDSVVDQYFTGADEEKKNFFNETINWMLGFKLLLFPELHPNHPKETHDRWLALGRERFLDYYEEVMKRIPEIDGMIAESLG
ncbi:MAG: phosphotransferase [Lachnospiraceae bacterium]|nr:phosphotransferase [Lachnospiraceae bacterium]